MGKEKRDLITGNYYYVPDEQDNEPWYMVLIKYIAMVILMFIFVAGLVHIFVE